jgi:hypothetical protein
LRKEVDEAVLAAQSKPTDKYDTGNRAEADDEDIDTHKAEEEQISWLKEEVE